MLQKKILDKLSPALEIEPQLPYETSAAVLILFSPPETDGQGHLVLTKRTSKVDSHKGQMSFPGGFREKTDKSWLETALRETQEEIGVPAHQITIWGRLEPVLTKGTITIVPYVGGLRTPCQFQLNADEVEKIVLLPVEKLLQIGLQPVLAREAHYTVQSIGITWDGELIWGATAKLLEQIYRLL